MRKARWFLPLLAVVAVGCGAENGADGSDSVPTALASVSTVTPYGTGHAVALETVDAGVLSRETELEKYTNEYRVANLLPALLPRDDVRSVARAHSEHMIAHSFFAHQNPEGDDPRKRAERVGVVHGGYGENIAAGYASAWDAFNAFLNSPPHRANIEDPLWTGQGAGYAYSPRSDYQHYWTQNFVRP